MWRELKAEDSKDREEVARGCEFEWGAASHQLLASKKSSRNLITPSKSGMGQLLMCAMEGRNQADSGGRKTLSLKN